MSERRYCETCGRKLPADALDGLCPYCVMRTVMAKESNTASDTTEVADENLFTAEELEKMFPQLKVVEIVGYGATSVVYEAGSERHIALKLMSPKLGGSPTFAERFRREARRLGRLNHPNIVKVHDTGQVEGVFYLIMDFVEGKNL